MRKWIVLIALFLTGWFNARSQAVTLTSEQIVALTPEWKGPRFADGRPHTPDRLLERLKNVSLEEAWGILRNEGYHNQYEGDWKVLRPMDPMVGRAVTAQYMPLRPEWDQLIREQGKKHGRIGNTNSWPIDVLQNGDLYIADSYGKIIDGTLIGDNLGNSIFAHSNNGVIFYGSVRDWEGLSKIEGFNAWVKGYDPSYIQQMMLASINHPIRIGRATVLPGDVILAKEGGIIAIPPHLLEKVVLTAEFIALRDQFGHQRLREGKYTPGQIDTQWTDEIKSDFIAWLDANPDKIPMTRAELDAFMKDRTW